MKFTESVDKICEEKAIVNRLIAMKPCASGKNNKSNNPFIPHSLIQTQHAKKKQQKQISGDHDMALEMQKTENEHFFSDGISINMIIQTHTERAERGNCDRGNMKQKKNKMMIV